MIWAGAIICVTCLMVGGLLAPISRFHKCALSIIIGYGIVDVYMCFIGMQGSDLGLPTSVMAGGSLGRRARSISLPCCWRSPASGWFGVQSAVCGLSFSAMCASIFGINIPPGSALSSGASSCC
jgi:cytosine permease